MKKAKVLLLYTDPYYLVHQVYPFGLDILARYLRHHGHRVTIEYPFLPDPHLKTNLLRIWNETRPDVVGLGIRNVDTCLSCEPYGTYQGNGFQTFYFLPEIKEIAEIIRGEWPDVPVVAGGGGFTISPEAMLDYLGLDYGIVGEGEEPLREFVAAMPDRGKIQGIGGLVYRDEGRIRRNPRGAYVFPEEDVSTEGGREGRFQFAFEKTGLPVQVKRGCNQGCSYCVEPMIEGGRFHFREMDRVVRELEALAAMDPRIGKVFFVDTEFNLPDLEYAGRLLRLILRAGLHERFSFASQFLPRPFHRDFARLLAEAGFSIILTCDSFSDTVLRENGASYRKRDVEQTLEICEQEGLPLTLSMIFGLPGETHETIEESILEMKRYGPGPLRRYEYTVGGRIYSGTRLCRFVEKGGRMEHVYGTYTRGYLAPRYYCAPESPIRLKASIQERLGFTIAYEPPLAAEARRSLGIAYMADQGRWEEAVSRFLESGLPERLRIYDYLFRRLAANSRVLEARLISERTLADLEEGRGVEAGLWMDRIRFYLSCLGE